MKKLTYLLFIAIGAMGCSVESVDSTENLLTADMKVKSQSAVTISGPEGVDVFCAGETYTFSLSASTNKTTQIQQYDEEIDNWIQVFKSNDGVQSIAYFDIVIVEGDNRFRTVIAGEGQSEYPIAFEGVVCNPCENSLEVDLVCGDTSTASFTFTAVEAGPIVIQGGLTNDTDIVTASSNVLTRNLTHNGVLKSSANVTRWEGYVEACEVVTITIEFTGGNGIGDWTAVRLVNEEEEEEEEKEEEEEEEEELLLGETAAQECN